MLSQQSTQPPLRYKSLPLFSLEPSLIPLSLTFLPQVNSFLSEPSFRGRVPHVAEFHQQHTVQSTAPADFFFFLLRCVFITGVRRTQPTQSVESLLYLKHHTYPVVPFNTYQAPQPHIFSLFFFFFSPPCIILMKAIFQTLQAQ